MFAPRTWPLLASLVSLLACSGPYAAHSRGSYTATAPGSTQPESFEWLVDGKGVAVLHNGELGGAAAFGRLQNRAGYRGRRTLHDHPRLEAMAAALTQLEQRIASDADFEAVQALAGDIPFPEHLGRQLTRWAGDDPERAAQVLDGAILWDLGEGAAKLLPKALQSSGLTDQRLSEWVGVEDVNQSADLLLGMTRSPAAGANTHLAVLANIEEVSYGSQADLLGELAPMLLSAASNAAPLTAALFEIPYDRRGDMALAWIEHPNSATELSARLLEDFDELPSAGRLEVFQALAARLSEQPGGPRALAGQLDELYGEDRYSGALAMLERRECTAVVLEQLDEVYGQSREQLFEAIVESPGYGPSLAPACLRAAQEHFHAGARKRAIEIVQASAASDAETRRKALLLLQRQGGDSGQR